MEVKLTTPIPSAGGGKVSPISIKGGKLPSKLSTLVNLLIDKRK